jgi:hypothetical protein
MMKLTQWCKQAQMAQLDISIHEKIGDLIQNDEVDPQVAQLHLMVLDDVFTPDEDTGDFVPANPESFMPEMDGSTLEAFNKYLTAEVLLPRMGTLMKAKVVGHKQDADGNPVGQGHHDPILDTCEYQVEFPNGATDIFTANIIVENMYLQVNTDG